MNLNEKIDIEYANTFFKRFKGLMFKKDYNCALIFTDLTDSTIHTCFMRFDIDIFFLDETQTVFDKASLKPWKVYKPKKQAKYIIETKKDKLKIKIGECLDFI